MEARRREVKRLPHHVQDSLCTTRAPYRQGRILTAVKVYTVNDESQHLIISGVPSLGLQDELRRLCNRFGDIKSLVYIPNYDSEKFVEAYHVHFSRIQSARHAKRHIDGRAFFGGSLHVCYAPEMEAISETRSKLIQRRHEVTRRSLINERGDSSNLVQVRNTKVNHTSVRSNHSAADTSSPNRCIWNGKETFSDPRILTPAKELERVSSAIYGPQRSGLDWTDVGVREVLVRPRSSKCLSAPKKPCLKQVQSLKSSLIPSQNLHELVTPKGAKDINTSAILRLVPSQIKSVQKKIIFHPKADSNPDVSTGNQSLDSTIQSVRQKIRDVTVPNMKVQLDKDYKIP